MKDLYKGRTVLGTDNGNSGHMVFLDIDTHRIVHIEQCPAAKRLVELLEYYHPEYAATEEVFMSPGFRGVASTGFIVMGKYMCAFELLDIPFETIRAVSWRKALGLKAKGRAQQKEVSIQTAQHLFHADDQDKLKSEWRHIVDHHRISEIVYDDNKCESALIAEYSLLKWREEHA